MTLHYITLHTSIQYIHKYIQHTHTNMHTYIHPYTHTLHYIKCIHLKMRENAQRPERFWIFQWLTVQWRVDHVLLKGRRWSECIFLEVLYEFIDVNEYAGGETDKDYVNGYGLGILGNSFRDAEANLQTVLTRSSNTPHFQKATTQSWLYVLGFYLPMKRSGPVGSFGILHLARLTRGTLGCGAGGGSDCRTATSISISRHWDSARVTSLNRKGSFQTNKT